MSFSSTRLLRAIGATVGVAAVMRPTYAAEAGVGVVRSQWPADLAMVSVAVLARAEAPAAWNSLNARQD